MQPRPAAAPAAALFSPALPHFAPPCTASPCSGANRGALNADGKTALEVAQLNEQEDIVKALS